MAEINASEYMGLEPPEFAKLVKSKSADELTAVMSSEARRPILDAIFQRMPAQFRPERAGKTSAVVHWTVGGGPGGSEDTYELVIDNGTCTLSEKPEREPKLALSAGPVDFLKVISGNGNPVMMFMTGKLKAKGDLGLAANISNLFDVPKA